MTKQDKLQIREMLREEIAPIREMVQSDHQILHGTDNDGIVADVRDLRNDVGKLKNFRSQVYAIGGTLQFLWASLLAALLKREM